MGSRLLLLVFLVGAVMSEVKHVHLFDQVGQNYLFRSGSPEVAQKFSYPALTKALALAAQTQNVTLPPSSQYELYVINVENLDGTEHSWPDDGDHVISEHNFFANNTWAGKFFYWHMVGSYAHAATKQFVGQLTWLANSYPEWGTDRLVERVPRLRDMLTTQDARPRVIVFHCDCGCDRTGQLAGSYVMKYHGKSWTQAYEWNKLVAGRPQTCQTYHQMQWYCLYLQIVENVTSVGDCLKGHPCTPV